MLCAERDSLRHEQQAAAQNSRASIRDLVILVDNLVADSDVNLEGDRSKEVLPEPKRGPKRL
jgi:hypothetical protein